MVHTCKPKLIEFKAFQGRNLFQILQQLKSCESNIFLFFWRCKREVLLRLPELLPQLYSSDNKVLNIKYCILIRKLVIYQFGKNIIKRKYLIYENMHKKKLVNIYRNCYI